jgi:hypothetical protein
MNKIEYKVLEFGSGDSTLKLYDYFKQKVDNVVFYSYESDPNFMFGQKYILLLKNRPILNLQGCKYIKTIFKTTYI